MEKNDSTSQGSKIDVRFEKLGYLLNECASIIKQETTLALESLEIGPREAGVLIFLSNIEPIVQQDLAEATNIDRTTTMKIIVTLEGLGYIKRKRDPNDSRAYIISVTPKGYKTAKTVNEIIDRVEKKILGSLSKTETNSLMSFLNTLLIDYRSQNEK